MFQISTPLTIVFLRFLACQESVHSPWLHSINDELVCRMPFGKFHQFIFIERFVQFR